MLIRRFRAALCPPGNPVHGRVDSGRKSFRDRPLSRPPVKGKAQHSCASPGPDPVPPPHPRSALQVLHKACEVARRHNYFPGGVALIWATYYESCISSDQSCINEWNAMQDLESTRPDSPALFVDK